MHTPLHRGGGNGRSPEPAPASALGVRKITDTSSTTPNTTAAITALISTPPFVSGARMPCSQLFEHSFHFIRTIVVACRTSQPALTTGKAGRSRGRLEAKGAAPAGVGRIDDMDGA